MSDESKFLMLGLRGSGKTTYLAAIWHHLESDEIADRLSVPQLQPDRNYLNAIRTNWLDLRPVGRTSMRAAANVALSLLDRKTGGNVDLLVPDHSGESFRLQWATRKAPSSYVSFARDCKGAFLFIHPNEIKHTHVIKPELAEERADEIRSEASAIVPSEHWTPAQSSTQVQLVDVLQLLLRIRRVEGAMRLAVVISAWDLVKSKIPPAIWLEGRMPLLSQFVRANPDRLVSEVFGVSAQGGDLTSDRAALLASSLPSSRSWAVRGATSSLHRITAPLQFLLNGDGEAARGE